MARPGAISAIGQLRIYVLVDALGWPVAQAHRFLAETLPMRRPVRTVLGYSSGAIPSILTGEEPARHGRWNLLYFDPRRSPFRWLRCGGPLVRCLDNRYGRAALTRIGRHLLGLGPGFECALPPQLLPWFNWGERQNLYAPGSIPGRASAFDLWRDAGVRYAILSYRDGRDLELIRRAHASLEAGTADAIFLYLSELDGFLHEHRSDAAAVATQLALYERALSELHQAALARDPGMRFRVFSDHGMATVHRRVDLAAGLRALPVSMPRDYLAVLDSTMARFWFRSREVRASIEDYLHELDCGRVVEAAEMRRLGIWFDDSRYGELLFLLHPGVMMAEGSFNGHGWNPCGMHGYHPDDPDSDAVLLSNEAADLNCTSLTDLFGCLCEPIAGTRRAA